MQYVQLFTNKEEKPVKIFLTTDINIYVHFFFINTHMKVIFFLFFRWITFSIFYQLNEIICTISEVLL